MKKKEKTIITQQRKIFEKIEEDYFLEYNLYNGNYYGTPRKYINEKLSSGNDIILEIEINGALKIKELIPDAIFIFILPPNIEDLIKRLEKGELKVKKNIRKI